MPYTTSPETNTNNINSVPIPAAFNGGVPLISHLTSPLMACLNICQNIDDEQSNLCNRLLEIWNLEASSNQAVQSLIKSTQALANQSLLSPSDDPSIYYFVGDTFDGNGSVDSSTTCYIDNEAGSVMLPIQFTQNLTPYVTSINVLNTSVGRPGDFTAVRTLNFDSNGNPVVGISVDPSSDISSIVDGKPDTWYCWENVSVPRLQSLKRCGSSNAIVADSSSSINDVQNIIGGYDLTVQTLIPGQGNIVTPLFNIIQNSSSTSNVSVSTSPGAGSLIVLGQNQAVLALQFSFSDPVPLSSINISSLIESGFTNPAVISLVAALADGTESSPVGLPRPISPAYGKQISTDRALSAASTTSDYSGSSVFFVNSGNVGAVSLSVVLTCDQSIAPLGIAHQFYVDNTETKERTVVAGVTVGGSNSNGQNRIAGPSVTTTIPTQNNSTNNIMSGVLSNIVSTSRSYSSDLQTNNNSSLVNKLSNPSTYSFGLNINTGNSGVNAVATNLASNFINSVASQTNAGSIVSSLQQSASAAKTLAGVASAFGLGNVASILGGPAGFIAGAALTGNLFNQTKTTSIISTGGGVDVLTGYRAPINIQDITFDSRVFFTQGEVDSTVLRFPDYVRAVQLFLQADIPVGWPSGYWITAQIQAVYDSGQSDWTDISPQGVLSNPTLPETITFDQSFTGIKVKIQMQRPSDSSYENQSPILNSYAVKGLPS